MHMMKAFLTSICLPLLRLAIPLAISTLITGCNPRQPPDYTSSIITIANAILAFTIDIATAFLGILLILQVITGLINAADGNAPPARYFINAAFLFLAVIIIRAVPRGVSELVLLFGTPDFSVSPPQR